MFNMFSGGAVQRMAIFSLNVMPYISASIIVQLLGTTYPPWEKLRKEGGEAGRKQLNQYTRYLTVLLAVFQSFGIARGAVQQPGHRRPARHRSSSLSTVVTLTGGTMFLMWLGEQITSRGVGNGISLIIFAGIVARLPVSPVADAARTRGWTPPRRFTDLRPADPGGGGDPVHRLHGARAAAPADQSIPSARWATA